MSTFEGSMRLAGRSLHAVLGGYNKAVSRPFATKISIARSKSVLARRSSTALNRNSATRAVFSTHSSGLRKIQWTDLEWIEFRDVNAEAARLAFEKSNPFNDPRARNCLLFFADVEIDDSGPDADKVEIAEARFMGEACIVQEELNKITKRQGNKTEWPVFMKFADFTVIFPISDVHFVFKLPSGEDPKSFEARLREAGLEDGELMVLGGKGEANEWWYRFFAALPKTQKYWEG